MRRSRRFRVATTNALLARDGTGVLAMMLPKILTKDPRVKSIATGRPRGRKPPNCLRRLLDYSM